MNNHNVLNFVRPDKGVAARSAAYERELPDAGEDYDLRDKGMGLLVAVVVSLGLWAIIWLVVASFVSE
jgi:hypothetical protein